MKELSRIAEAVQASTTMAIDAMFKQMKADGIDVIGFGAGEPDFDTPDEIKAAGIAAIESNLTRYTPAAGTVELRQAVCDRMKDRLWAGVCAQPGGGEQRRETYRISGPAGASQPRGRGEFCPRPSG